MRQAHFLDFEFNADWATFYPRPETELLVEKALEFLPKKSDAVCNILDIGTGCGNIAISLTKYVPSSRIVALDISDAALRVASENASASGVAEKVELVKSNLFEGLSEKYRNFFDLIISNPPYISRGDFSSLSHRVKEDPFIALYGGKDGLDFYRRIAQKAGDYLKKEGILIMEIGYDQAERVKEILNATGKFGDIELYKDYSGIDRIVKTGKG